jgi:hypothetical protein
LDGQPLAKREVQRVVAGTAGRGGVVVKVILCKRVSGGDEKDVFVEKEYDLPFLPVVGMFIVDGSIDEEVIDLLYDHKRGAVEAWCHPDTIQLSTEPADNVQTRVEIWEADGFKVVENEQS